MNIELVIMDENVTYDCKDKADTVKAIIEEYKRHDICIGELLHSLEIRGLSIQDVVDVFAKVMNIIEGDEVIQKFSVDDGSEVKRWDWLHNLLTCKDF